MNSFFKEVQLVQKALYFFPQALFKPLFIISVLFCCVYPLDAAGKSQYIIKFATVAPDGSAWVKHLRLLDKDIRKKTNNRLQIRIYAGGIAGDELDVLKKIRIGQIHCAAFSGVGFGQILPMVRVMDLPFLFPDDHTTDVVHNELLNFFSEQFRKKGFELLAWAEVGNVHIFSKKPIRKIQDLSGLKIWAWAGDPIAKETFKAMGINPIPLAITDVNTSLHTGMLNTVYAPPLGALALQWDNTMKYMQELPLVHSTGAILISSRYFNKLPPDLSGLLCEIFDKYMKTLTLKLREQNQEALYILKKNGITITPCPTGADLADFRKIHDVVAKKLVEKIYPKDVLERVYRIIQTAKKKNACPKKD